MITPQDIHAQEFKTAFRGYDKDEVDAFLQAVADSYQAILAENISLKDKIPVLESQLRQALATSSNPPTSAPTPGGDQSLAALLAYVKDISAQIIDAAKRQAELILHEAALRARIYSASKPPESSG